MRILSKTFGFARAARSIRQVARRTDAKTMALREAERLRAIIISELDAGAPVNTDFGSWPKHKPLTLVERELEGFGGTKPLIRSAAMRGAVNTRKTATGAWTGVSRKAGKGRKRGVKKPRARKPRKGRKQQGGNLLARLNRALKNAQEIVNAKTKKDTRKVKKPKAAKAGKRTGMNLANVAELMEFGSGTIAVKITPAMRRFLFGVLFKKAGTSGKTSGKRPGFVVYRIPARPFLRPAEREWERTLSESVGRQINEFLGRA